MEAPGGNAERRSQPEALTPAASPAQQGGEWDRIWLRFDTSPPAVPVFVPTDFSYYQSNWRTRRQMSTPSALASTFRRTGTLSWTDDKAAARWLALTDPATVSGQDREDLLVLTDWWVTQYGPSGVGYFPAWRALIWT